MFAIEDKNNIFGHILPHGKQMKTGNVKEVMNNTQIIGTGICISIHSCLEN